MKHTRRKFIKTLGLLASGSVVSSLAIGKKNYWEIEAKTSLQSFGLQLYSLREDMSKSPKEVLSKIAEFGYTHIESFEGSQGIYWGMPPLAFAKYLSSLGLNLVAAHCNTEIHFEKKVNNAHLVGIKHLISPWVGPQKSTDDFKRIAEKFNALGKLCKDSGIRFAYHNHDYSFSKLDGVYPQDILMQNTDPELVDFEMDIYWVVTASEDPIRWLKKYPNRFRLCHIKDRLASPDPLDYKNASCNLGKGVIDFNSILTAAKGNGMKYFIVEQERYDHQSPLESAKSNASYLKSLRLD